VSFSFVVKKISKQKEPGTSRTIWIHVQELQTRSGFIQKNN